MFTVIVVVIIGWQTPKEMISHPIATPSRLIAVVFLFISGIAPCRANLGESEAQCVSRYGTETGTQNSLGSRQVGDKAALFNLTTASVSLDIKVIFLNGLSCHESFSNADSSHGLSDDQMKDILKAQSAGLNWSKQKTQLRTRSDMTYGSVEWLRTDGATATFWVSGNASSQSQSGQVDLSSKYYAYAQHFYDKENGEN